MSEKEPMPGVLYVVATPIGNLEDISPRALKILGGVDWVAAEDTRRTRILMDRHGLKSKLISFYGDVESFKAPALIEGLVNGESGAVVSDAGTPGASDPGGKLVAAAAGRGVRVTPIPGPSAIATVISVSGFDSPRFVFDGFLPKTGAKRANLFKSWANEERHIVFFESAKRVAATMADLYSALGNRRVVICRELTKLHEEITRATLEEIAAKRLTLKEIGEYTLIVEGAPESEAPAAGEADMGERMARAFARTTLSPGEIARIAAELCGGSKNIYYQAVLDERKKTNEP
ncbi:MAG: 16S rRNA (cytidine(1402)-2'-O)-methyltransferase [bacterium]